MEICARCKKRPATVFITKVENNVQKQEGLCLICAKEKCDKLISIVGQFMYGLLTPVIIWTIIY